MTDWVLLTAALMAIGAGAGFLIGRRAAPSTPGGPSSGSDTPAEPGLDSGDGIAAEPTTAGSGPTVVEQPQQQPASVEADWSTRDVLVTVLDRYPVGVVIADESGEIGFRNAAARSYDGTHVAALLDAAVERRLGLALARRPHDEPDTPTERSELVEFYGPPRQVMAVTTERLIGGVAVAFVEDVTESDRLDRVRTDFVANVSHELKTPIGALTLLAEALADETDEGVRERLIARMEIEADRAAKTIDHLVELSEIESSPAHDPSFVEIRDLVDASVDRVLELARHRSVTIEVSIGDDVVRRAVRGQRAQIESALGNLVENAVAYSPPTSVVVVTAAVKTSAVAGDPDWIEVSVVDNGVGIPKGQQDRIFERFYRVDRARSRETGGTGLGLSIVKRAAISHGGSVSVTSTEGEGSTFVLRLPLVAKSMVDGDDE